ncbi:MAG: carbamoyltransferase [Bacteriovoracaceae bacterium]|jgi:carbamoyltransferase
MEKKTYILGISAFYHDSAACLICDGEIIAAVAEERFSRIKHDESFPIQAIKYCLSQAKINISDLYSVTFYEKPFVTFERLIETYLNSAPRGFSSFKSSSPVWLKNKIFIKSKINDSLQEVGECDKEQLPKLLFSSHHQSHAASAFFPSPYEKATIICVDGVGEYASTSIWSGDGNKLELIKQINFPDSIGLLYSAFTYYCGFKVNDGEYKLMGLAPYGEPKYVDFIFENLVTKFPDGSFKINQKYFSYQTGVKMTNNHFDKLFDRSFRKLNSDIKQVTLDLAASIQSVTEILMLNLVKHAKDITANDNLCLAGGVALNCVANGKIFKSKIFESIWIQPAASDAGGSLGAAYATYYCHQKKPRLLVSKNTMKSCYLGPEYSSEEISKVLKGFKANFIKFKSQEELVDKTSYLIDESKVIGWFQGKSEFGPRALGNRSILGNARCPKLQKSINIKIKNRESFRPFAPVILEEDISLVFQNISVSPYMLLVDDFLPEHRIKLGKNKINGLSKINHINSTFPAVTHVNSTGRIQTINQESNPLMYQLLSKIKERSLIGIAINTSFNVNNEPIVNSPTDAYKCFMRTDMDYLVIGDYLLDKKNQPKLSQFEASKIILSKNDILKTWAKIYLFTIILSYITLPFLGFERKIQPAIIGLTPFIIYFLFPNFIQNITKRVHLILSLISMSFNTVLLAIVYYIFITPYAFTIKMCTKSTEKSENSNWKTKEELRISESLF